MPYTISLWIPLLFIVVSATGSGGGWYIGTNKTKQKTKTLFLPFYRFRLLIRHSTMNIVWRFFHSSIGYGFGSTYKTHILSYTAAVAEIEMLWVCFFIFRRFPNFIEYFSHIKIYACTHKPTSYALRTRGLWFFSSHFYYCAVHTESRRRRRCCCWLLLVACCLAIHRISSWFAYT